MILNMKLFNFSRFRRFHVIHDLVSKFIPNYMRSLGKCSLTGENIGVCLRSVEEMSGNDKGRFIETRGAMLLSFIRFLS